MNAILMLFSIAFGAGVAAYLIHRHFVTRDAAKAESKLHERLKKRDAMDLLEEEQPQANGFKERVEARLARAGSKATFRDVMIVMVMSVVFSFITGMAFFGDFFMSVVCGVCGVYLPFAYLHMLERKRRELFTQQTQAAVRQMHSVMMAGRTIQQAIESVSDFPPPLGDEFKQVHRELRLGASLDEALDNLLKRIETQDTIMLVAGLKVARLVKEEIAVHVLDDICERIREREMRTKSLKAKTAAGRATANFVGAIPIVIFIGMYYKFPDYIMPHLQDPAGQIMTALAFGLDAIGIYWAYQRTAPPKEYDF